MTPDGGVLEGDLTTADLLNAQTGRIGWGELARHFARGVVICVGKGEDLVAVAELLVEDRAEEIGRMYESQRLHRAMEDDAVRWQENATEFWAVVVAPWVLVQEIGPAASE
jgi:hypothetical protein